MARVLALSAKLLLAAVLELFTVNLATGEALLERHQCAIVADLVNEGRNDEYATTPAAAQKTCVGPRGRFEYQLGYSRR